MAKRRRVKPTNQSEKVDSKRSAHERGDESLAMSDQRFDPLSVAAGFLGGAVVYVAYYPSDSVAVEKGDALWFTLLSLVLVTITCVFGMSRQRWNRSSFAERFLLIGPWILAAWMMIAAWGTASTGNLRMATNEAWLWVTAAAVFTSSRILSESIAVRRALTTVAIVCAFGLAVHGLHQYFVSLPANRAEYEQNPERILQLAGVVDAPPGSAERMVFENRLFDGGPTGTFALANSLAAYLLVGIIGAIGILRLQFRTLTPLQWGGWIGVLVVCIGSLMAARSRSATLAMFVGILFVLVAASIRGRNKQALWVGVAATAAVAFAVIGFLATMGNREWFEEAPASLAFRFQYWRSSWNLVLDSPVFGAGPGNFQSIYERYREASAHEQIAEPHNLFVETLTSGGFVALGLLLMVTIAGGFRIAKGSNDDASSDAAADDRQRWVWLGAVLSLVMVWLIGFASRRPPDLDASLFVVPLSVAMAFAIWPSVGSLSSRSVDLIWLMVVIAIGIHLTAAGGWTVPGVAIALWVGGGVLTREQADSESPSHADSDSSSQTRKLPVVMACVGVVLIGTFYLSSLRPVEEQKRLMSAALRIGQPKLRRERLKEADAADPWSVEAALWLAEDYRWSMVVEMEPERWRQDWIDWVQVVKQRGGDDPAIYRMIGIQQLHVYQRHGNPDDLHAAAETFGKAAEWSPSNQWMMAQMAVIAERMGDRQRAEELTRRAWELSELGGNIERALSRQQVMVVRRVGPAAERGPIRAPASDLLPDPR